MRDEDNIARLGSSVCAVLGDSVTARDRRPPAGRSDATAIQATRNGQELCLTTPTKPTCEEKSSDDGG